MKNEDLVKRKIEKDEQILWQGTPDKKAYCHRFYLKLIPFSIVWIAVTILIIIFSKDQTLGFVLGMIAFGIGIPVLVSLSVIFLFHNYNKNEYYITNKKIFVFSSDWTRGCKIIHMREIDSVELVEDKMTQKYGTVCFGIKKPNTPPVEYKMVLKVFKKRKKMDLNGQYKFLQNELYEEILYDIPNGDTVQSIFYELLSQDSP